MNETKEILKIDLILSRQNEFGNLYRRSNTKFKLNILPKVNKYLRITDFILTQDFGYLTKIISDGNYMVIEPVHAETFYKKHHTPEIVNKDADVALHRINKKN